MGRGRLNTRQARAKIRGRRREKGGEGRGAVGTQRLAPEPRPPHGREHKSSRKRTRTNRAATTEGGEWQERRQRLTGDEDDESSTGRELTHTRADTHTHICTPAHLYTHPSPARSLLSLKLPLSLCLSVLCLMREEGQLAALLTPQRRPRQASRTQQRRPDKGAEEVVAVRRLLVAVHEIG